MPDAANTPLQIVQRKLEDLQERMRSMQSVPDFTPDQAPRLEAKIEALTELAAELDQDTFVIVEGDVSGGFTFTGPFVGIARTDVYAQTSGEVEDGYSVAEVKTPCRMSE
jgi:hypothetical protein